MTLDPQTEEAIRAAARGVLRARRKRRDGKQGGAGSRRGWVPFAVGVAAMLAMAGLFLIWRASP